MNPSAIQSLVEGYTHDHSLCTVCIQAKNKKSFIKVPVKHTTKPFELVHSDVCDPFCTPTYREKCYVILFIDDYTRYTSIWLLPNMKVVIGTTTYMSLQALVDSMGYEMKLFRHEHQRG
jgi:hypothetical protein